MSSETLGDVLGHSGQDWPTLVLRTEMLNQCLAGNEEGLAFLAPTKQ